MKKILMSFLMMAMIAGCVQQAPTEAEKPEEPPVVEQPEKPVEQEKPEETEYVKKIDESKDWVYFDEPLIYEFELSDNCGKASTYLYEHDLLKVNMPIINIDLEQIKELNRMISNQLNKVYESVSYYDDSIVTVTNVSSQTFYSVVDDILSVEIRSLLIYGEVEVQLNVYNIDLVSGKILSNADLLSRYGLDFAKAETLINQALYDKNIPVCEIHKEYGQVINEPCYFDGAKQIDEGSLLKLNDQKQLICIMNNYFNEDSKQGYPYANTETEILIMPY